MLESMAVGDFIVDCLKRIDSKDFRLGMKYSAPVFFEDGKNMFLAPGKDVKPYHLFAIKRWNISFLLTSGIRLSGNTVTNLDTENALVDNFGNLEVLDQLEEAEELEELENVDEDFAGGDFNIGIVWNVEEIRELEDLDDIEELEEIID